MKKETTFTKTFSGFVNAISQAIATVNGVQTGDVAQSFSLHAVGSGNPLFINVNSNASSDVIADIIQVAGQTDINPDETGETSVVTTDTTTHTEVKPESQFNANVDGASEVIMHLDNIAVSGGQIDAEVVQVADVDFVSQDDIEEASPVVLLVPS